MTTVDEAGRGPEHFLAVATLLKKEILEPYVIPNKIITLSITFISLTNYAPISNPNLLFSHSCSSADIFPLLLTILASSFPTSLPLSLPPPVLPCLHARVSPFPPLHTFL